MSFTEHSELISAEPAPVAGFVRVTSIRKVYNDGTFIADMPCEEDMEVGHLSLFQQRFGTDTGFDGLFA